jgi:hypothetical protein
MKDIPIPGSRTRYCMSDLRHHLMNYHARGLLPPPPYDRAICILVAGQRMHEPLILPRKAMPPSPGPGNRKRFRFPLPEAVGGAHGD